MPIWKQHLLSRVMAPEGGDDGKGGGGGGGGGDSAAAIQKAVDEAVAGLKAKNSELLGKLKERDDKLKDFDGIDPNAVRNILKRFADDEEAKLIADGKIDDVLNRRTERMKADYDKKLADAMAAAESAAKRAQAFQGRVLDDSIRAAAVKAGLHQHAIDDALFRARSMFTLDESGQAIAVGDDGKPVLGKDGKSPFTPLEWLEGMKEKAPHWYPATASGGGASGGGGSGAPSNKKASEMTPGEKAKFIADNGLDKWNSKVQADYAK
jgi:hypothetical protein